jgi:hypothetical protein
VQHALDDSRRWSTGRAQFVELGIRIVRLSGLSLNRETTGSFEA